MTEKTVVIDKKWFLDQAGDALYQFFQPLIMIFRYLFKPNRYRVTFSYDNGMTAARRSKDFTADNDHQALSVAKEMAGEDAAQVELEYYREVKIK